MKCIETTIKHEIGLHARPATLFVQTVQKYNSKVTVGFKGKSANGRSLLGVLSLGVGKDAKISITAEGDDEEDVLDSLKNLVDSNFGE